MKIFGKNGKMKINEFIQKYRKVKKLGSPAFRGFPGMTSSHTPYVVCKDGFEMSVQAGQSLYSEPRDVADSYEEAEVGFPSTEETLLTSYAEDSESLCDTVYGYVPCSIIDQVIEKHGGIDESKIKEIS
jgi:hypothetical protein